MVVLAEVKPGNPVLIGWLLLLLLLHVTASVIGQAFTAVVKKGYQAVHRGAPLVFPYENENALCKFRFNIISGISAETVKTNLEVILGSDFVFRSESL